jgi:hypothetical protein
VTWFVGIVHVTQVKVIKVKKLVVPRIKLGTWHDAQNVTDHPGKASITFHL